MMDRGDTIDTFRAENPEITDRVISTTVLQAWCVVGEKEVAAKTRLIKGEKEFAAEIGISQYDLMSRVPQFFDIDEFPGGGVCYNNKALTKTSIIELNQESPNWRTNSNGTPKKYYRRGKFLHFEKAPDATSNILVDTVLLSDDWDDDNKLPFNELTYLEPFHYSLVLYLTQRAKAKVGKDRERIIAKEEYNEFIAWMAKEVNRGIFNGMQFKPRAKYYS